MKYSVALVAAALAGVAQAQADSMCLGVAAQIPQCGTACLTSAGSSAGCDFTSLACQCSNSAKINNAALSSCVLSACGDPNMALAVSSSAVAVCSCVASAAGANTPAATTSAAVPQTTVAVAGLATPTSKARASSASAKPSQFTGGAAYASGAVGGILAGVLGIVAAL